MGTLTKLAISKVQKFELMFLFYVPSFFKKGDTIQGGTLFKEIRYALKSVPLIYCNKRQNAHKT